MSGPLLDRIDIFGEVPRISYEKLGADHGGESSETVRERVEAARERQLHRLGGRPEGLRSNARLTKADMEKHCRLDEAGRALLREAVDEGFLSPRAHDRVLRVARTLADLEDRAAVADSHVSHAIDLRVGAHPLENQRAQAFALDVGYEHPLGEGDGRLDAAGEDGS